MELYHHGIKGQKWGVRRYQNKNGSLTSLGEKRYKLSARRYTKAADAAQRDADDLKKHGYKKEAEAVRKVSDKNRSKALEYQKKIDANKKIEVHEDYVNAHSKKSIKSMSNQELQSKIKRLQLEQQYSELNLRQRSEGVKFVNSVLREAAKNTASFYVSKYMRNSVDYLIKKNSPFK